MKNIIRIETLTIIDDYTLLSFEVLHEDVRKPIGNTPRGLSSRGYINDSHQEKFLVLFNRFRFLLKSTKPNK